MLQHNFWGTVIKLDLVFKKSTLTHIVSTTCYMSPVANIELDGRITDEKARILTIGIPCDEAYDTAGDTKSHLPPRWKAHALPGSERHGFST